MLKRSSSFGLLLGLLFASSARAQTPAPASAQPADRAPAPARRRARFFAQAHLGGGYFHATSGASDDTRTFSGGSVSWGFALGGRIGRYVTIAGAFSRNEIVGVRYKDAVVDGDEPDLHGLSFALWMVGPLLEVRPQEGPGLYLQGVIGPGVLSVSGRKTSVDNPSGLMGSLAIGYDFDVGEHWALGGQLRATYAPFDVREVAGTQVDVLVPALLLTAANR